MLSRHLKLFEVIKGVKVGNVIDQQTVMSAERNLSGIQIQIKELLWLEIVQF